MSCLATLLVTAKHLRALKQVQACTNNGTLMVVIGTSSHGNDNQQVPQLLGSKSVSSVTTMHLATKVLLQLLRGQVVAGMARAMADTVVLLEAVQRHGSNRHLHHHHLLANLATDMVATLEVVTPIKVQATEHHQRQHHQVSALSCSNTLELLPRHRVRILLRLLQRTTLRHRPLRMITLRHLPRHR